MSFTIKNLSFGFNERPVLDAVNFSVTRGRMTAIMGLNGSGKTTLLKLMSGYLKPHQGEISFSGKRLNDYTPKELGRELAWIAQEVPLDFPFTVAEFVRMGRYAWQDGFFSAAKDFEMVHVVLKKLDLTKLADRKLNELSGGERQRVLIARAFVQEANVILLDEPLNHLDIKRKFEILDLLKNEVVTQGKTVIAVLHEIELARRYFDEVVLLKEGVVQYSGNVPSGLDSTRVSTVFEAQI